MQPTLFIIAYCGGVFSLPGLSKPAVVDLSGLHWNVGRVPILLDHDFKCTVGHAYYLNLMDNKLKATGVVSDSIDARTFIAAGRDRPRRASIGAWVDYAASQVVAKGERVQVNNRMFVGPLIIARKATLREISIVPAGAEKGTRVILLT